MKVVCVLGASGPRLAEKRSPCFGCEDLDLAERGPCFGFRMMSGSEDLHPHEPALQHTAAKPPFPEKACSGWNSEREKGPEPQSTEDKHMDHEAWGESSFADQSESENSSEEDEDRGWKRQRRRGSRRPHTTGSLSDAEYNGENLGASLPEGPASAHHSCSEEAHKDSSPQRAQRRPLSPGPNSNPVNKKLKSQSPRLQRSSRHRHPSLQKRPSLRRGLVMALRCLSQAVYEDVVQVWRQQVYTPLSHEHRALLTQLQVPLTGLVQTLCSMGSQAAWAFPAEGWMVASSPMAQDAQCSSHE
ncbi:protein FRG2-like-1 [Sorex fumeus]|uniref:protein FRG2-like-1 n=1 Tax=Sorex fumeus TaxID=62283 RepID=UPI0024AE2FED|nr:protein FRG2-like-1 [Sorex fumeus]